MGQQRGVQVVRFTIENTVEDRILELQARKRHIAEGALGKTDGTGVNPYAQKLSVQDLVSEDACTHTQNTPACTKKATSAHRPHFGSASMQAPH